MNRLATFDADDPGGDLTVARIAGEVDASNVSELGDRLLGAVSNQTRAMILDLSDTSYLDSAGVQLLFDTSERLRLRQIEFRLVTQTESFVMDVLSVTQVPDSVIVHGTVEEAKEGLGSA